jgi:hypothetical protein
MTETRTINIVANPASTGKYRVIVHQMPETEFHIDADSCDEARKIALELVKKEKGELLLTGTSTQRM